MHALRASGYAHGAANRAPASTRFNILPPKVYPGLGPVQLPCALNHYCIWYSNCLRSPRRLSIAAPRRSWLMERCSHCELLFPLRPNKSESAVAVKGPLCAVESLRGLLVRLVSGARAVYLRGGPSDVTSWVRDSSLP